MKEVKLLSWNVNGLRALVKKAVKSELDFYSWVEKESPNILCLQETKATKEQMPKKLLELAGYESYWSAAERKGYSGVVTFTKDTPIQVSYSLGKKEFDNEGRHIITEFPNFVLLNVYFPNGKKNQERLRFKMEYYDAFLTIIENYRKKGKSIIFCGDVNTAHREIDLSHPKANEKISGFLPIERAWIDKLLELGYIDTFRYFHPNKTEQYTWWSMRNIGARERNVGWRLDYFFVSNDLEKYLSNAFIMPEVYGSDHCPVGLQLKF
ncbi:MAG: exodeoxyribonuclease III [Candidatus Heimdallarchaeota archaeon]